ncbi:AP2-associated protein kinase 1, variant 2 [Balamuthia mandrillaris]
MHKLASGLNSLRGGLENLSLGGSPGGGAGGGGGGGPSFGGGGGGSNIEAGTIFAVEGRSYRVVKRLAEGGFAFVFLVQEISTGQPFALKRIMVQDQEHLKIVNNEISLLRKYGGPDKPVIGLFGSSTIQRDRFGTETVLVTEYCENGSLLDLMLRRIQTKLREDEIFAIFTKVCEAVHYLHSQDPPVAHRDLKVENVLMHRNGMLKLGDFGSATTRTYLPKAERDRAEADEDIQKNTTLFYRSPEMVDLYKGELINEKCDIWALGCLLFKLAFYVDAFDGALGILNCSYRVPEPCPYSSKLTAFIAYLLDEDPYKRPDIYSVLKRLGVSVQRPKHAQKRSKPDLKSSRDGSRFVCFPFQNACKSPTISSVGVTQSDNQAVVKRNQVAMVVGVAVLAEAHHHPAKLKKKKAMWQLSAVWPLVETYSPCWIGTRIRTHLQQLAVAYTLSLPPQGTHLINTVHRANSLIMNGPRFPLPPPRQAATKRPIVSFWTPFRWPPA